MRSQSQLWPSLTAKLLCSRAMLVFPRSLTHTHTHMLAGIYCLTYLSLQNWGQNPGSFLCKPCKISATKPRPQLILSSRQAPPSLRPQPGGRVWQREMLPCPSTKGFFLLVTRKLGLSSHPWVAFLALSSETGTQPSSCFLLSPGLLFHP